MTRDDIIKKVESLEGTMDFQKATALHIYDLLTDPARKNHRVLLADEVGLGKTIVARAVVSLMREYQREVMHDDFFRVVYVCSNINIASQNIDKLGVEDKLDINVSRLSMQHFSIAKKDKSLSQRKSDDGSIPEVVIPLTPTTSFDFRSRTGTVAERSLICALLENLDEFNNEQSRRFLTGLLQGNVYDTTWSNWLNWFRAETLRVGQDYIDEMVAGIRRYGSKEIHRLYELCQGAEQTSWREPLDLTSSLRRVFAEISLDKLKPDLVIMDEFQRFKNLLTGEGEQRLLADRFFSDHNTKVLLLSATPYKPYSTLEELTENEKDEHFSDFKQVVGFLEGGNQSLKKDFDEAWTRYNVALSHISRDSFDVLAVSKKGAEDSLYALMSRTERFNVGGVKTVRPSLPVTAEDIKSYFQARTLLDMVNEVAARTGIRSVPMDYVKSSPYLLSFMDNYKMKEYIVSRRDEVKGQMWDLLYLPLKRISNYKELPLSNARLQYLYDSLFSGGVSAERLLWVPASRPYYVTHGVYSRNAGFSKTLLFSSWQMVPRMVSCLISYSAERIVMKDLLKQGRRPGSYYRSDDGKSQNRYGANRFSRIKDEDNPLLYLSPFLAGLYNPATSLGQDIKDIRKAIEIVVKEKVAEITGRLGIPLRGRTAVTDLTILMRLIEGEMPEILPERFGEDSVENLVSIAIGAPASCAYRIKKDKAFAKRVAAFFIKMFNRPDPALVIDATCAKGADNYIEAILDYCVEGNLQAVLDEYDHLLEGKWEEILAQGPLEVNNLRVEMQRPDQKIEVRPMRNHIAIPFTTIRMEDKAVTHTSALRRAFNSPFRPFVLCTTSVGQEGLDFHWYARKLLHWNLPSNPVDMEQREGRVNRYKCLSIRQRLGALYSNLSSWDKIFEAARAEFKRSDSDIVPYWSLPDDFPDDKEKLVERIILEYPLSQDQGRYERMKKILSLYRLTMGQPRQEELLEMLANSGLSSDQIKRLMINLSPYYREKENEVSCLIGDQ